MRGEGKCESVSKSWGEFRSGDETCEKARGYGGGSRELEGLWRVVGRVGSFF